MGKLKYFLVLTILSSVRAFALDSWVGHVTIVEASYMPTLVQFQTDSGSTTCPANSWLKWSNANVDNNKSVFALLLAASASGQSVHLYTNAGDTTCTVQFVHIWAAP
jgi:hypothetical protein